MIKISKSPQETKEFAQMLLKTLKGGEILGLVGNLGTGKTVFVQGLAEALSIKEVVNSPTFVLMKSYKINRARINIPNLKKLIHIDAYRLESFNQLKEIGAEEYLNNKECLVVVEWADRVKEIGGYQNYIEIKFKEGGDDNQRIIEILGTKT